MPQSIMSRYYQRKICRENDKSNDICHETKSDFWNKWWNRDIKTVDDRDGWDAQLDYLTTVVKYLNNRRSTVGFEILNEPEIFKLAHYRQVGRYHSYMSSEMRKITGKPLLLCWTLPHGVIDNPASQALVRSTGIDNNI